MANISTDLQHDLITPVLKVLTSLISRLKPHQHTVLRGR